MHILFVIYSMGAGGAERVTSALANHWSEKGFCVTIVTFAGDADDFYELNDKISKINLHIGIKSVGFWNAMAHNIQRVLSLRQALRQHRPHVAIAMMSTANILLALAGIGLRGFVKIGSERTYPPMLPLGFFWERLRWLSYGLLDAIVVQTQLGKNWLLANTSSRRVVVIENPLVALGSSENTMLLPELCINPDDHLLLAVGRLEPEKGFDLLLRSFVPLASRYPGWRLVILGEGKEREELEDLCHLNGLLDKVLMPGRVGNILHWYKRADLFVLSSRMEGFPNALVEAMAAGLPAVSFNCLTGPAEIIRHGRNGFLVPAEDPQALADALDSLMGNKLLRRALGREATRIGCRLEINKIATQWESLFLHPDFL